MKRLIRNLPILTILIVSSWTARGADYYWVGGTGNWSDYLNHWSTTPGGSSFHTQVPTSNDDVFFDINSFTGGGQSVTLDQTIEYCQSMDWTGVVNYPTLNIDNELQVYGSMTLNSNMAVSGIGTMKFLSTTSGNTIDTKGQTFNSLILFDGIGGDWTLLDSITLIPFNNNVWIELLNGTLNTNNQKVTTYKFYIRNNSVLNMSGSTFELRGRGICWQIFGFPVINAGTSTIVLNSASYLPTQTIDFSGGNGYTYYNLLTKGAITGTISGISNFNKIHAQTKTEIGTYQTTDSLIADPGVTLLLSFLTTTVNMHLGINGNCAAYCELKGQYSGVSASLVSSTATISVSYTSIQDVSASGGASFVANNSHDAGGNSGWTITPAVQQDLYWVGGNGDWSDPNHWSLSSGGSPASCVPGPTSDVFFDANSFPSGGDTVVLSQLVFCRNMDWTGALFNPVFSINYDLNILGSLTFIPNMNITYSFWDIGTVRFGSTLTGNTITSANQIFKGHVEFDGIGGEWTLQDSLSVNPNSGTFYLKMLNGTIFTNDQTINASSFWIENGAVANLGNSTIKVTGSPWGWLVFPGAVINAGTSTLFMSHYQYSKYGTKFDDRATNAYYNLVTAGLRPVHVYGPGVTFNKVTINVNTHFYNSFIMDSLTVEGGFALVVDTGTTQIINNDLFLKGDCASLIDLKSSETGFPATFNSSSAVVQANYTLFQDINATGGASFVANNSYNLGGNSGWTINAAGTQDFYWIGGQGDWSNVSNWSLTSGGVPGTCLPGPLNNVYFDSNSFSSSGDTVTVNALAATDSMDWTGATFSPAFTISRHLQIFGSLTLISDMDMFRINVQNDGIISFRSGLSGNTITSADQDLGSEVFFNGIDGEWTLQDSLTTNSLRGIDHINGTLNTNGKKVTTDIFKINDSAVLNMDSSLFHLLYKWTVDGSPTINSGTSTIMMDGYYSYNIAKFEGGEGESYHHLITKGYPNAISGTNISFNHIFIKGETTFKNTLITDTLEVDSGTSLIFNAGDTLLINNELYLHGSPSYPVELSTTLSGIQSTILMSSGIRCFEYLYLTDIIATGGAGYFAGLGSDDVINNSGWLFNDSTPCSQLSGPDTSLTLTGSSVLCVGDSTTLSVPATSDTYQWFFDGVIIPNDTTNSITTTTVGSYFAAISYLGLYDTTRTIVLTQGETIDTTVLGLCYGDSILIGGQYENTSGTYVDSLVSLYGCDSIEYTTLLIGPNMLSFDTLSICQGDSILLAGSYQSVTGSYSDTLTSISGCDSILITALSVVSSLLTTDLSSICDGDSILLGGSFQSIAGSYSDTFTSALGCDSILITTLTIIPPDTTISSVSICSGDSILLGGSFQSTTGSYSDTFTSVLGCDSVYITSLTVVSPSLTSNLISICDGDSAFWGGSYQTSSGTYVDSFTSTLGCDSILLTTLSFVGPVFASDSITICDGDSVFLSGNFQSIAGAYSDTLTSVMGCDSVLVTTLSIMSTYSIVDSASICQGDSILLGGSYQKIPGSYMDMFATISGCDSLLTTFLTFDTGSQGSYTIEGSVYYLGSPVTSGEVYLIVKPCNSPQCMIIVDSVSISPDGSYQFTNVLPDLYMVKAAGDTALYPNSVPTYADSTNHWQKSQFFDLTNFCLDSVSVDIFLIDFPTMLGFNRISGTVTQGNSFGGVPFPKIQVMLERESDSALMDAKTTDNDGVFSFSSVPAGTFKLFIDKLGYIMDSITIFNIDTIEMAYNVEICIHDDSSYYMEVCQVTLNVLKQIEFSTAISVYPNPFNNSTHLDFENHQMISTSLMIYNSVGELVRTQKQIDPRSYTVERRDLSEGVYFFRLISDKKLMGQGKLVVIQ